MNPLVLFLIPYFCPALNIERDIPVYEQRGDTTIPLKPAAGLLCLMRLIWTSLSDAGGAIRKINGVGTVDISFPSCYSIFYSSL